MSLEQDILAWDGKSAEGIRRIYLHYSDATTFVTDLVRLVSDPATECGATWLLKHHLETVSLEVPSSDLQAIYSALPNLEQWESKLHILQSIQYLPIPLGQAKSFRNFLNNAVSDDAKFVRAWAYHGWHELGRQFPEFREEAQTLLNDAMETETAASVKVRIRKALEAGF